MKSITRQQLESYLKELLLNQNINDYCPNGLQIEGCEVIKKIVTGVTASQALIDKAIEAKADALLVHHGYFWKGEDPRLIGLKYQRVKKLMTHHISLFGFHLPLDIHPQLGNNSQLAKHLGIELEKTIFAGQTPGLLAIGLFKTEVTAEQFAGEVQQKLSRIPLWIQGHSKFLRRIAFCTGAAQDFIEDAINQGVDAFLTGEVSERTVHIAREAGIHFYACGHHATERYGIKALGEHVADYFGIEHCFIDIDNPV